MDEQLIQDAHDADVACDAAKLVDCIEQMDEATFNEWRRREGRDWWGIKAAGVTEVDLVIPVS